MRKYGMSILVFSPVKIIMGRPLKVESKKDVLQPGVEKEELKDNMTQGKHESIKRK